MKPKIRGIMVSFTVIMACAAAADHAVERLSGAQVVNSAGPYTIVQRQVSLNPGSSSTEILMENRVIALASNGSRVSKTHDVFYHFDHREVINASGIAQEIYDDARVVTTVQYSPGELAAHLRRPDPQSNCATYSDGRAWNVGTLTVLGNDSVLGVPVVKLQFSFAPFSNYFVYWLAPSLNCEILYMKTGDGSGVTASVYTDQITRTEPDPSLFVAPGYAEASYSTAFRDHLDASGRAGQPVDSALRSSLARADAYYASHRP